MARAGLARSSIVVSTRRARARSSLSRRFTGDTAELARLVGELREHVARPFAAELPERLDDRFLFGLDRFAVRARQAAAPRSRRRRSCRALARRAAPTMATASASRASSHVRSSASSRLAARSGRSRSQRRGGRERPPRSNRASRHAAATFGCPYERTQHRLGLDRRRARRQQHRAAARCRAHPG